MHVQCKVEHIALHYMYNLHSSHQGKLYEGLVLMTNPDKRSLVFTIGDE